MRWGKALFEVRALPADATEEMTRHSVAAATGGDTGSACTATRRGSGPRGATADTFPVIARVLLYFPDSKIAVAVK